MKRRLLLVAIGLAVAGCGSSGSATGKPDFAPLAQALRQRNVYVRIASATPAVSRAAALRKLKGDMRPQDLWLVHMHKGGGRRRWLAWMSLLPRARIPVTCMPGHKCGSPFAYEPLASFLDARTGRFILAVTVSGWKP